MATPRTTGITARTVVARTRLVRHGGGVTAVSGFRSETMVAGVGAIREAITYEPSSARWNSMATGPRTIRQLDIATMA
jgi:hypothetical protein